MNEMIFVVEITKQTEKQLRKVPRNILDNLMLCVAAVEHDGLEEVLDEPLKGDRSGQRTIRSSGAYS